MTIFLVTIIIGVMEDILGEDKMENKMILKVFDIDYSFIIKNYLDPKLWQKEWTLFIYKKFVVTLRLKYIYVYKHKICFEIKLTNNNKNNWNREYTETVEYSLNIENINILKKNINKRILYVIEIMEKCDYIEQTEEFKKLISMQNEEREKLTKIAEEFLDDNDIENEDIREAYIEAYVSNTEKVWDLKQDYKNENRYKMLPDLYLTFARATNNKELEKEILETNFEKKEELLKEIEELEEYMKTEEYENNMRGKLEEL